MNYIQIRIFYVTCYRIIGNIKRILKKIALKKQIIFYWYKKLQLTIIKKKKENYR